MINKLLKNINWRFCALFITEFLAIALPLFFILFSRTFFEFNDFEIQEHYKFLFLALVVPLLNIWSGLYRAIPLPFPRELSKISQSISCGFLFLTLYLFLDKSLALSRYVFILAFPACLFSVPIGRILVRNICAKYKWWQNEVLLIGRIKNIEKAKQLFQDNYKLGLNVIGELVLDTEDGLSSLDLEKFYSDHPATIAITVYGENGANRANLISAEISKLFKTSIIMPSNTDQTAHFSLEVVELAGYPCVQIQQNLLMPRKIFIKRCIDIFLTLASAAFIIPVFGILALMIKLDSPGSVFYKHKRVGYQGKTIWVWKFRTMMQNADQVLEKYLSANPEMLAEWQADQKLKDDPRITRVGKILRKTSLDELPQLFNVIKGEMSLVGPRPIVEAEISKYGEAFYDYIRVFPGLTGLWQVSGRNDLSYSRRIQLDQYYISNWSVWFDIWLIARTIPVVLFRNGAY